MFLLSQIWLYLLIAFLLGMLAAWLLGLCNCNRADLEAEVDALRGERDDLSARLTSAGAGAVAGAAVTSAADLRKIAALEAELAEARVKADELARASSAPAGDEEEAAAMRWRNRYLEARVKFLEEGAASPGTAAPAALAAAGAVAAVAAAAPKAERKPKTAKAEADAEPVKLSVAGSMSDDELEAAVLAAGEGRRPPRSRARSNPDELLDILGVGPVNKAWLNDQGIYYFRQIAEMAPEELAWIAANLPKFGSRVYRENWAKQCFRLAQGLPPKE
jgi:hypothetical protein